MIGILYEGLGVAWSSGMNDQKVVGLRPQPGLLTFDLGESPFVLLSSLHPVENGDWIKPGRTCNRLTSCPGGVEILPAVSCH